MIFPLAEGTKDKPRIRWRNGSDGERATCDHAVVEGHWRNNPRDNIGIDCGESLLLVVDTDSRAAWDWLDDLWYEHERTDLADFGGPVVRTRRGWHLYFELPIPPLRNTTKLLHPAIDTRADGGQVPAPGSVVYYDRHGNRVPPVTYKLGSGDLASVPPLPPWLEAMLRALEAPREGRPVYCTDPRPSWQAVDELRRRTLLLAGMPPDSGRNDALNTQAFVLRRAVPALGRETVEAALWAAAEANRLVAEDGADSVRGTLNSGLTAPW